MTLFVFANTTDTSIALSLLDDNFSFLSDRIDNVSTSVTGTITDQINTNADNIDYTSATLFSYTTESFYSANSSITIVSSNLNTVSSNQFTYATNVSSNAYSYANSVSSNAYTYTTNVSSSAFSFANSVSSNAFSYANSVSSNAFSYANSVSSNLTAADSSISFNVSTLSSNTWRTATSSTQGLITLASDAQAQAQTNNGVGITPYTLAQALKAGNQSLATNGYQKFPGGLVIAWATGAVSNAEAEQTITLPYTFTTIYNVQCSTITGAGLGPDRTFQVRSWTTSQVVVFNNAYNTATGNGTPHLLVIGV